MKKETVEQLERLYNINISFVEKIRNVYKIFAAEGTFCLKSTNYNIDRFRFILNGILYLCKNECDVVLEPIKNKDNKYYCIVDEKYSFMTEWIEARHADYSEYTDIVKTTNAISKLHKASRGYAYRCTFKKELNYGKWVKNFKEKIKNIEQFRNIINQKDDKTRFDEMYLGEMDNSIELANQSITMLTEGYYKIRLKKDRRQGGVCHHDLANHNILVSENSVKIIDFDYMILDSPLHDIASLLIRTMKDGNWNLSVSNIILQSYSESMSINLGDIRLMAGFMEFPQDFWQVGIQYYNEKQKWEEEVFVRKLTRYIADIEKKNKFITEFYNCNFEF